jgi:hypothetical protein
MGLIAREAALGETLAITLPAPVGQCVLLASNAAFSRFRQITRERGIGPIGPCDEAGRPLPGARPRGVELRGAQEWAYIDDETFPLLLWVLATTHQPQLRLETVEEVCTPLVAGDLVNAVLQYCTSCLLRILKPPSPAAGGAGPTDPPPAPSTPSGPIGTSGATASGS